MENIEKKDQKDYSPASSEAENASLSHSLQEKKQWQENLSVQNEPIDHRKLDGPNRPST